MSAAGGGGFRAGLRWGFLLLLFELDFDGAGVAGAASACGEDAAHSARRITIGPPTADTPVDLYPLGLGLCKPLSLHEKAKCVLGLYVETINI
jgi:hypothetical protein